jgi:hypothetical protein
MKKMFSRHSLIIWGIMVLYIITAPLIHDRFFLREGRPLQTRVELPGQAAGAKAFLDSFELYKVQDGIYQAEGWGFLTSNAKLPAGAYERQVVLASASEKYVFPAKTTKRVDVHEQFSSLGMDLNMSGFLAYINRNVLGKGTYNVGLILKNSETGALHYVDTGRCVTRTPNNIILEEVDNFTCRLSLRPNIGKPVDTDVELPASLEGSQARIDRLLALDEGQGLYQLVGWAFPALDKSVPLAAYERQVVLVTSTGNLVFRAEMAERTDVQVYFKDLDMDLNMSGFSTHIKSDMLRETTYEVGLIFKHTPSNSTYFVSTQRCLRRDDRALRLEDPESPACPTQ